MPMRMRMRMRVRSVTLSWPLLAVACSFDSGGSAASDASIVAADAPPVGDGSIDAVVDPVDADLTPDADPCLWDPTPAHFDPCLIAAPSGPLVLDVAGTWVYDTETGDLRDPDGSSVPHQSDVIVQEGGIEAHLISVQSFEMKEDARGPVGLRVVGERPLIIASWSSIELETGTSIDVSTQRTGAAGAGANPAGACDAATPGTNSSSPPERGGGGGGGFGGPGGDGGRGNGGDIATEPGNGGGVVPVPEVVRGGCHGAQGGGPDGGGRGRGGGAVQLTAKLSISLAGGAGVHAGGAGGGTTSSASKGGGGAGSGGYVGLDAPSVVLAAEAAIAANGGGGGEGNGDDDDEEEPGASATLSAERAAGGSGSAGGGDGGRGSGGLVLAGEAGQEGEKGGGGGGGGAGYILLFQPAGFAPAADAIVSPPVTIP